MVRGLTIILFCFFLGHCGTNTVWALHVHAIQTSVSGGRVCGLTGQWLQLPDQLKNAARAWVAIVESDRGGPAKDLIRWRNRTWVSRQLMPVSSPSLSKAELDARFRHCRDIQPRYFEAVLVQHQRSDGANAKCSWIVDWDLDQDFSDEVPEVVSLNLMKPEKSEAVFETSIIEIRRAAEHQPVHVDVYQPFPVAPLEPAANPYVADPVVVTDRASRKEVGLPESLKAARSELWKLDEPSIRKQHLQLIVKAADVLLEEVDQWTNDDSQFDHIARHKLVAEALYRRGRALGYMELPDVIAVHPIKDQQWLDSEFEATFVRLQKVVDVTQPEYILLAIRRERRRGNRGIALNLVNEYRRTHPDPIWHFKKKLDLMRELEADLHAYQVACEMWLKAEKPDRPTCCVIRFHSDQPPMTASDEEARGKEDLRRLKSLEFSEVRPGLWEAVAWLLSPDRDLSQRVLDAELSLRNGKLQRGTVRCFSLSKT